MAGLLLGGCSVERNNPLSKAYHNTSARYNGYFLAREKMKTIEEGIQEQMVYDYNQPLPAFPSIDSTTAKAFAADLEDVVKKASHPIQWHKNSKWIDDSYLLIGKVRYYQLNFPDAIKTFRFVNSTSKEKETRHEALVWLMRTFLQIGDLESAQEVNKHLKQERLNKDNARELYLARVQYHRMLGDTAAVIENLELSLPNFDEKDAQSRVRFSLARLYQSTDQDKEAYKQYSKILRNNPPYDLSFFSRLYMGQVSELSDVQDTERIASYYQKLLKDSKNTEYKDKIYYEMALFELRQQNYQKALEHLRESIKTPGTIKNQKAYSYLLAGEIYFENLNNYNLAQAYYDSAVQVFPQQAAQYEAVVERRNILTEFAKNYSTVQTQDSLQQLARMGEAERLELVRQMVQREEEKRQQELTRQQERALAAEQSQGQSFGMNRNNDTGIGTPATGAVWYFDNPAAVATALAEFTRRWGNRPLQDNWRIRSRGEATDQAPVAQEQLPELPGAETAAATEERLEAQVQSYLQNIPLTPEALAQSDEQIEEALFNLGNIYSQKLKDPVKAAETYEQLLQRFPKTEHAAETYYSLFLIHSKADDERKNTYYTRIKQQFPNSTFAKLVDDPDFLSKNAAENIIAHTHYDSAYRYYEQKEYKKAAAKLAELKSNYSYSDIPDKIAYLGVLVTARTEKPQVLREQLLQFKTDYPNSPLQANADKLLAVYTDLEQKNLLRQEAPSLTASAEKNSTLATVTPEEKVSTEIAVPTPAEKAPESPQAAPALTGQPEPADTAKPEQAAVQPADTTQPKQVAQPSEPATQVAPQPVPADTAGAEAMVTAAEPDPMAYSAAPDSAYYVVMVYPTTAPAFKDVDLRYEKYNNTYHKKLGLTVEAADFSEDQTILVMRSFSDENVAQDYKTKQKFPQSPVGRIRGVEFTTFVISSANYQKLLQKKDLEAYLDFYRNNE
ncbi:type IX secretion system periplasmic lipoprotein PorW/SprE [Botryobacter ruber]